MKTRLYVALLLLLSFGLAGTGAHAAKPVTIDTCWMDEAPGFIMWYAKEKGWDKEEGLDVNMLLFSSGPAQMEALPSKQWQLGATSTAGYLVGAIRHNVYEVSTNISEGTIEGVYVRPNHPALKVKGWNKDFPEVYGSPETVKGMTILYTSQTGVHYMVGKWLQVLGLKETDVKLVNMEQPSAIPAFEKGVGDAVALWAPFTYSAESRGWPLMANPKTLDALTTSMYVGDREWCDKNPELVAKFLRVHYRVVDVIRAGITPELVKQYQQYMNDFCGIRMTEAEAKTDLEGHPFWTLKETMEISEGDNPKALQWQDNAAKFFTGVGRFSQAEYGVFHKGGTFTTKFLKLLK